MRRFTSVTAAAAITIASIGLAATPAEARHRHGGWGYRHHDGVDAGDVIGGLLIIGTIAAIASAASKDKAERRERHEPPRPSEDYREMPQYEPRAAEVPAPAGAYGGGEAEARAADACSWAVEAEMGDDARVDSVTGTKPNDDGWHVTGTASRGDGEIRSFGCQFSNGRVVHVNFDG